MLTKEVVIVGNYSYTESNFKVAFYLLKSVVVVEDTKANNYCRLVEFLVSHNTWNIYLPEEGNLIITQVN